MLKSLSARLFIAGLGLFALFILFSYIVHKDILTTFDFDTTVRLQDNISRKLDDVFSALSVIGSFEVLVLVLIGFLIWGRRLIPGIFTFFLFGLFHVIEIFGKTFV